MILLEWLCFREEWKVNEQLTVTITQDEYKELLEIQMQYRLQQMNYQELRNEIIHLKNLCFEIISKIEKR
jgi:hypothetical protein